MKKKNKNTKEQSFKGMVRLFKKWQNILRLNRYEIEVIQKEITPEDVDDPRVAQIELTPEQEIVIELNINCKEMWNEDTVIHELLHIVFWNSRGIMQTILSNLLKETEKQKIKNNSLSHDILSELTEEEEDKDIQHMTRVLLKLKGKKK